MKLESVFEVSESFETFGTLKAHFKRSLSLLTMQSPFEIRPSLGIRKAEIDTAVNVMHRMRLDEVFAKSSASYPMDSIHTDTIHRVSGTDPLLVDFNSQVMSHNVDYKFEKLTHRAKTGKVEPSTNVKRCYRRSKTSYEAPTIYESVVALPSGVPCRMSTYRDPLDIFCVSNRHCRCP